MHKKILKIILLSFCLSISAQTVTPPSGGGGGGSLTPCGPTVGEVQLFASSTTLGCDPLFTDTSARGTQVPSFTTNPIYPSPHQIIGCISTANMASTGTIIASGCHFATDDQVELGDCLYLSSNLNNGIEVLAIPDDNTVTGIMGWCGSGAMGDGTAQAVYVAAHIFYAANSSVNTSTNSGGMLIDSSGNIIPNFNQVADVLFSSGSSNGLVEYYVYDTGVDVSSHPDYASAAFVGLAASWDGTTLSARWRVVSGDQNTELFSVDAVTGTTFQNGLVFANLGSPANGTQIYCSDCTVTSGINDTCAGSGSGAWAQRINGVWSCRI